jgi:NADH-quinone oxidoreductase subunit C
MSNGIFDSLPLLQDACPDVKTTGLTRDLFVAPENIVEAARRLLAADFHLEDISGLDTAEAILVNYHFNRFDRDERMALRVIAPHHCPSVPSIAAIFGGAEWHERELSDFFGVVFQGNPNPVPLLLPETGVVTPLLKSEKSRISIKDVVRPGRIVHQDSSFTLFTPESSSDSKPADTKEAEA